LFDTSIANKMNRYLKFGYMYMMYHNCYFDQKSFEINKIEWKALLKTFQWLYIFCSHLIYICVIYQALLFPPIQSLRYQTKIDLWIIDFNAYVINQHLVIFFPFFNRIYANEQSYIRCSLLICIYSKVISFSFLLFSRLLWPRRRTEGQQ